MHHPFDTIASNQILESAVGNLISEEAQTCSETGIGVLMDLGQFSSIQASTSVAKLSNLLIINLYLKGKSYRPRIN